MFLKIILAHIREFVFALFPIWRDPGYTLCGALQSFGCPAFRPGSGDKLDVIMIVETVAHGTQVDPLTPINLAKDLHEPLRKSNDLLIDVIGSFAHVVIVFHSGNAHMTGRSRIADKEAFNIFILIEHLIRVVAIKRAAVFSVETGRTDAQIGQLPGRALQ